MLETVAEVQASGAAALKDAPRIGAPLALDLPQQCDLGLQLMLILLDRGEASATRRSAAESAESLLSIPEIGEFVENRLYSAPLPGEADVKTALGLCGRLDSVSHLLSDLGNRQEQIRAIFDGWNRLPLEGFGTAAEKAEIRRMFVDHGIFRKLVAAEDQRHGAQSMQSTAKKLAEKFPASAQTAITWLKEQGKGFNLPAQAKLEHAAPESDEEPVESFADALRAFDQSHSHKSDVAPRQLRGTVVSVSADQVFLDIGYKTEGVLPRSAFDRNADAVKPGDSFPVSVTGRNEEGYYELSRFKVAQPRDWSALEAAFAEKLAIVGTVTEVVKGGVRVDVGVRAFMPASRSGTKDAAELEKLVGTEITCRITKLDVADEDVVVDRRVVLEEQARGLLESRRESMKEGDLVTGTVRTLMPYGAFVDLGGIDGLLHISDMSHARVAKPEDVVAVGQQIQVRILKLDPDTKKISLGLKQLQPEPWETLSSRLVAGQRIVGDVTRLTDFGAFVEIEPGVEGLIHISEMSWGKKVRHPGDIVKVGDRVDAEILAIKPEERRISLGLKHALSNPWLEAQQKFPAGSQIEGPVTKIMNFGAFVQVAEGVEGLVHVSEIAADRRISHPSDVLRAGQVVKAQVLAVDTAKRQIKLSMKQLIPTSIDEYIAEHKAGDTVSGRVVEAGSGLATVELGEGIRAICNAAKAAAAQTGAAGTSASGKVDLSGLSSMLKARWKGNAPGVEARPEPLAVGQIRSFKIVKLDAEGKKIEVKQA